jgi:hypothetical protein
LQGHCKRPISPLWAPPRRPFPPTEKPLLPWNRSTNNATISRQIPRGTSVDIGVGSGIASSDEFVDEVEVPRLR